jgi:hypothetical protein
MLETALTHHLEGQMISRPKRLAIAALVPFLALWIGIVPSTDSNAGLRPTQRGQAS